MSSYTFGPNWFWGVAFVVVVVVISILCSTSIRNSDRQRIRQWSEEQRLELISVDECFFDRGPFWLKDDDDRIYKVVVRNSDEVEKVAYFRIGLFRFDQEWYR